jgi:hypothetical protein
MVVFGCVRRDKAGRCKEGRKAGRWQVAGGGEVETGSRPLLGSGLVSKRISLSLSMCLFVPEYGAPVLQRGE